MITAGQFTGRKLADLIRLKELVDRFAGRQYVPEEEVKALKERFGEEPDILTWGDFFQTEVGSRYFQVTDEEFTRVVDTVHFDLISSSLIFTGKDEVFTQMVSQDGLAVYGIDRGEWTEEQAEQAHLYILLQYFQEMALDESRVTAADRTWFDTFVSHASYAIG